LILPHLGRSAALLGAVTIVFIDVDLHRLLGVASSMNCMAVRGVSVVCRRFVTTSLMVLGGFRVMTGRMCQVLRSFFVVFCSLLGHEIFSG